jgi:hypothetical protein
MESVEKIYSEKNWTPIMWVIIMAIAFAAGFFQLDIQEAMNIKPYINPGVNFFSGFLFALAWTYFLTSLSRPRIRICNHYLIRHRYLQMVSWGQVTNVEEKENHLVFNTPEVQFQKKLRISLSKIQEKEEIVKDIEKICEIKGIPFKKH